MSAKRQPERGQGDREALRLANRRLKKAQAAYSRFLSVAPINGVEVPLHSGKEMRAAQEELQAAEAELKRIYADRLRSDDEFKAASDRAERALGEGPPWDDSFSPNEVS